MNEEVIIINDEPFYGISNGTSYGYASIPKEFKPYFERLQKENKQLKERIEYLERSIARKEDTIEGYIHETVELDEYKEVIEEVREYVNNHIHQETFTGYMDSYELKKLLQILDKVGNSND